VIRRHENQQLEWTPVGVRLMNSAARGAFALP